MGRGRPLRRHRENREKRGSCFTKSKRGKERPGEPLACIIHELRMRNRGFRGQGGVDKNVKGTRNCFCRRRSLSALCVSLSALCGYMLIWNFGFVCPPVVRRGIWDFLVSSSQEKRSSHTQIRHSRAGRRKNYPWRDWHDCFFLLIGQRARSKKA